MTKQPNAAGWARSSILSLAGIVLLALSLQGAGRAERVQPSLPAPAPIVLTGLKTQQNAETLHDLRKELDRKVQRQMVRRYKEFVKVWK